jgi:hypothetical protein
MTGYILFYSNKCDYCKRFLDRLDKENLNKRFTQVCVDGNRNIPKEITDVPTIIVANIIKPLIGKAAFDWVDTVKQFSQISSNITLRSTVDKNISAKTNPLLISGGSSSINSINGISKSESTHISDGYAFQDDNEDNMTHKQLSTVRKTDAIILTLPEKNKINSKVQDESFRHLVNNRSTDSSNFNTSSQQDKTQIPQFIQQQPVQPQYQFIPPQPPIQQQSVQYIQQLPQYRPQQSPQQYRPPQQPTQYRPPQQPIQYNPQQQRPVQQPIQFKPQQQPIQYNPQQGAQQSAQQSIQQRSTQYPGQKYMQQMPNIYGGNINKSNY